MQTVLVNSAPGWKGVKMSKVPELGMSETIRFFDGADLIAGLNILSARLRVV